MKADEFWRLIVRRNKPLRDGAKRVTMPKEQLERLVRAAWEHGYRHAENDANVFGNAFVSMFGGKR